jgi:hypothetical protein
MRSAMSGKTGAGADGSRIHPNRKSTAKIAGGTINGHACDDRRPSASKTAAGDNTATSVAKLNP